MSNFYTYSFIRNTKKFNIRCSQRRSSPTSHAKTLLQFVLNLGYFEEFSILDKILQVANVNCEKD